MEKIDYTTVTEVTGYQVTDEQIQRLYSRYRFASEFCTGKDVLEVACGSGQGLGYLAKQAKRVVGCDYDEKIVAIARTHYGNRVEILQADAQQLPFPAKTFDVVILYEALYYLPDAGKFIDESLRVLKERGTLIIGSANREWSGFNPSPHSHRYFSASELADLLARKGFRVELFADCPVDAEQGIKGKIISFIKALAVTLHLIPKTMKGKELFKRLFYGKLKPLPPEITDGIAPYTRPVPVQTGTAITTFKVVFAVGTLK